MQALQAALTAAHQLPYGYRAASLGAYSLGLAAWVRAAGCLPAGAPRVAAALPAMASTLFVPKLFPADAYICTCVATAFLFVWLANLKIWGMCLNRGPLSRPLTFAQFAVVLVLPITPQYNPYAVREGEAKMPKVRSGGRLAEAGGSGGGLAVRFATKAALLGAIIYAITSLQLPRMAMEFVYALGLYAFLGTMMDGPASAVTALVGLRISPHFDAPFLASSLSDFWAARWNLTAGNMLRFVAYDPIMEGRLVHEPKASIKFSKRRRLVAMTSAFVLSGLIHEVMYWYATGTMTGKWLAFFSLQGPLIAAEAVLKKLGASYGIVLPPAVSVPVTLTLLIKLADVLFFPPATDVPVPATGIPLADMVVQALHVMYSAGLALVRWK